MLQILHIDSSTLTHKTVQKACKSVNIKYIAAPAQEAAIFSLLEQNKIDLIISGLLFDDLDGAEELIKKLNKSKFKDIPVIIGSSMDDIDIRERMFSLGVVDFICKDHNFTKRVENYLGRLMQQDVVHEQIKSIKIAALDDSRVQLKLMEAILSLNDIKNVDYYIDPKQLLNTKEEYHVFFIDIVMPKISGEQMVLSLREKFPNSIIIAISSIDNYKVISNILLSGADDYILKPYNASIMLARLKANVRTYMLLRKLDAANKKLALMAITDGLTNLYNHKYIFQITENEVGKVQKGHIANLSIILFDIDHFKSINDTFGHQKGDLVLRNVAQKINENLTDIGMVGRYGGEEFLAVLPSCDSAQAISIGEKIRQEISEIKYDDVDLKVTISGGISTWSKESTFQMMKRADEFLYVAKENGRNQIVSTPKISKAG